ncbi:YolD-like family protein [Paenibacillus bouchesdurhonensis]|uniref:YolD-like family protein n=1 Tax=Paenibacillus bouchesdurhonensis TaxID=1870990 RepID=UPI000DA5ECEC|nr:YolD-like family protein [Paenibacillus bouchesdurhonensis]
MNKLTPGTNMLWESSRMILPQHRESALRQQREETKRRRVELDDQEKEQVARFIVTAHKTRQPVKLRMFDEYEDVYVIGVIEWLDSLTARFKVDGEWFHMEDITELSWDAPAGD